jgi:tRNA modification GTPase
MVDPGTEVVLAGEPNVGKSSLINAIAGRQVSIVTNEAGTTRDAVSAGVVMGGMAVTLVDTAGQGADAKRPSSEAARLAMELARRKVERAGLLVWVTDEPTDLPPTDLGDQVPMLWVVNKSDLLAPGERATQRNRVEREGGILLSALCGDGVERFTQRVAQLLDGVYGPPDGVPVSVRQEQAMSSVRAGMERADKALGDGMPELAAEDLKEALSAIGDLLGESIEVDVLDRIFQDFCIGK